MTPALTHTSQRDLDFKLASCSAASLPLDQYFVPQELPADAKSALAMYERTVRLALKSELTGTGIILRNGFLLTCSHVLEFALSQNRGSLNGLLASTPSSVIDMSNASIEINDPDLDFAILRCSHIQSSSTIPTCLDPSAYLEDRCYLIGNPVCATMGRPALRDSLEQVISVGKITAVEDGRIHLFAPTINPGHSGGPIVDRDGKLLGLIAEQFESGGRGPTMETILQRCLQQTKRG